VYPHTVFRDFHDHGFLLVNRGDQGRFLIAQVGTQIKFDARQIAANIAKLLELLDRRV